VCAAVTDTSQDVPTTLLPVIVLAPQQPGQAAQVTHHRFRWNQPDTTRGTPKTVNG
jgi:hypothetical protein